MVTQPDRRRRRTAAWLALLALALAGALVWWRFEVDIRAARARAASGAVMVDTRCGPMQYEQAGEGAPLLVIHGAGGGHDQGMQLARRFARQGMRVIAVSRFGYLGAALPVDGSPAAQADANACLLDALGIDRAAVIGISAGALSAMQTAIRHPQRVNALVLVVPLGWTPASVAPPPPGAAERLLQWLVGSDFVFWSASHLARDQVIARVLGTPPQRVAEASAADQARIQAMLDSILPVSARAEGLRNEAWQATHLEPYDLGAIRAPTLLVSARDDGYGTYASAEYAAARIPGAKFIGYEHGGHMLVGHDGEVMRAILAHMQAYAGR